jgi:hypothetical protein
VNAARKIALFLLDKFGHALPDNRRWTPVPGHAEAEAAWLVVVHDVPAARTHGDVTFDRNAPPGSRSKALGLVRGTGIQISVDGDVATALTERLVYASMWTLVRVVTKGSSETYCVEQSTDRVFTWKGKGSRAEVESKRPHELRGDHRGAIVAVVAAKRKDVFDSEAGDLDYDSVIAVGLDRNVLSPPKVLSRLTRGDTIRNDQPPEDEPEEESMTTKTGPASPPMFATKTSTKTRMVEIQHCEVEVDRERLLQLLRSAGVKLPDRDVTVRIKWVDQKKAPAFGQGDAVVVGWDVEEVVEG